MSEAFLKVVNMSISAGWLVLAVLALRLILKKAPKWVNVLLWGIVGIRLICPFSIESALSLIPSTETISPEIMMDWTPEISTGIAPLDQVVNPVISTSFAPHPAASANPLQILIPVAANLWLLGVIIMLAYTAISYLTLRLKLRTAVILRGNMFQCETVSSPFVLGILKPRIYLPYSMDGQNLHHVVAHEQAHIRRKDHWWKPLGFLLLTVYWFNPLMWVAYILLCRDIELACDEKVIAELGNEQRADYTQALVACAVNRRMIAACPLAFGEVGVKDRIKSIMNYRKPTFWIIVTALVVCVVVAVCFLTDPNPSREFSMNGNNVSSLDPEAIVERILDIEDITNSGVHVNTSNFPIQVDSNFNWADSQTVSFFFKENHKTYSSQLRIYPEEDKYFLTEPDEWPEQEVHFLLRHYLEAIKYLPQYEIQQMAPADQYIIQHVADGRPADFDRVITYSSEGVEDTDGWYIHLRIEPLHATDGAFQGTGEDVIDVFYGKSYGSIATADNIAFGFYDLEGENTGITEIKIRNLHNGQDTIISDEQSMESILSFLSKVQGANRTSSKGYYGGSYEVQLCNGTRTVLSIGFGDDDSFNCGDYGDGYPARYELWGVTREDVIRFFSQYDSSDFDWGLPSVLNAKLLEIHDDYFLVEPIEGSLELSSASRIEVPMKNMEPSPEPQVGDILEIEYDGQLQETYPARITNPYCIRVTAENPEIDTILISHESSNEAESAVTITDNNVISYILSQYESLQVEDYGRPLSEERMVLSFYDDNEYKQKWIISYYDADDEIVTCGDAFGLGNRRVTSEFDYNWLLDLFENASIKMIPTNTDLLGCPAGALLVPIDGNVYRYELTEGDPQGLTVDELLYTFTEETHIEGIVWEVYSLKEYPDKTAVLMLSGTNSAWLCRYSPPTRCSEYALNQAMAAGYVVMEDGIGTSGQEIWNEFYDSVQQGKAASVTLVHYFTLDPERCDSAYYEVYSQDYPCLYECHLEYDGKTFTLTEPDGNDVRIRTFEYLMKYDNTEFYSQSSQTPGRRFDYVLTHDNRVTWEQIWNGLVSSYTGADIDHYSIYSEKID